MRLEEIALMMLYLLIVILIAVRFFKKEKGRVIRRFRVGKAMTIGNRQVQEDNYGICQSADAFLAVLADGMGKNYGGKISSQIAVDTMKDMFGQYHVSENPAYFFRKSFHQVNREILNRLDDGKGGASMGVVLIIDNYLYYAVAGNVKIAVYRNGSLIPLSAGHTIDVLVEDRFMEGSITREEALAMLENKRLYNYLGQDGFQEIEFFDTPVFLKEKDIVVLMSDGIFEGMDWKTIEEMLEGKKKCQQKAYEIIEVINAGNRKEKDNASIVLVEGFV
ncbi:MAG: protein phosphatase 2C domain-containing protein [Eubacterium sp.]|nr:protein phosphatase 2C domain-containing protein [Eubacterium sp.]